MKSLIEKLANGNVEYITPTAEMSDKSLDLTVTAGEKKTFEISLDTTNDRDCKGVVYSTDSRIEILNDQFFGKNNKIRISVDAKYLEPETKFEAWIVCTTNAGEKKIPCIVYIEPIVINTSMGEVRNLDDFMKLVSFDYEEALKLFLSKGFKHDLLKDDKYKCILYNQLIKNHNREIAMEEFLVKVGLKEPVVLSLAKTKKVYENITEAYGDVFQITRSCVGYVEIDVEVEGNFIHNAKEKITNDDFVGNTYEYPYLISHKLLHQGENRAVITLKTTSQTLKYDIVINNTPDDVTEYIASKRDILKIMDSYIDFRCGKTKGREWIDAMNNVADSMLHKNSRDMIASLLKAQMSILSGDKDATVTNLTKLGNMLNSQDAEKIEYYCYYLYLKTIYKKNSAFTEDVRKEIKTYFENGYDKWGLLWMILYLDDRYTQNPSLKYTLIKEQYNKGCTSPVMYFEAISVLNEQPALLRIINPFELQVLNFGAKKGIVSDKLVRQFMLLIEREKRANGLLTRILMNIYKYNKSNDVLTGICRMMINAGRKNPEDFIWYDRGVEADIKLAELMEYYVYTISHKGYEIFRPSVYMYFGYDSSSLGEYQAYLFADIIANKKELAAEYENFKDSMEKYVINNLLDGNINEDLVIVYKDIITPDFEVEGEMKNYIPMLMNSYELTVTNENITDVLICHKEVEGYEQVAIRNKRAVVTIYTDNPILLFVDNRGRRIANIKYKMKQMLSIRHLKAISEKTDNDFIEIENVNKCMEKPSRYKNKGSLLLKVWNHELINKYYKHDIAEFIIDYCDENLDGGELTDALLSIKIDELSFEKRYKLIELLINRFKFAESGALINKYGPHRIKDELILKYVNDSIRENEATEDSKILALCRYLFLKGISNVVTLTYLQKYYVGPTDEMYDMLIACKNKGINDISFEERLIVQMIFEGRSEERMLDIFVSFCENDGGRNIRKAFYTYTCFNNFVKGDKVDDKLFDLLESDIRREVKVSEVCKMAYLGYITTKEEIDSDRVELCKNLIYDLAELNIVFEFYKKFNKWFKMPYSIMDKTIIDYRTNPKNKVFIMYSVHDKEGNVGKTYTEEMRSVFPGIFLKQLTMFYGDKVVYTIIDRNNEEITHTSEQCIHLNNKEDYNTDNKFGQINGMLICDELEREDALVEMMKNYEFNKAASEQLFKIL
ncbi:MAG: hypothetical protein E7254_10760 [Lachnospiraceae bacterium]|nr:hypothetical protein [Lachnospiraceae bacterium]